VGGDGVFLTDVYSHQTDTIHEQNRTEHNYYFCFDLDNMSIIYTIITYTLQDQSIKQICTCTIAT